MPGSKLTILWCINFLLLQWFFIRLARIVDIKTNKIIGYNILGIVLPLTGWWSRYIWIYRLKRWR